MADNFLERRMEDLRAGRLAPKVPNIKRKPSAASPRRPLEGLRVVVTGGAHGIGEEIVRQFRAEGASVDLIDCDRTGGNRVAQNAGARFHCVDISDTEAFGKCIKEILEFRGDIDVFVSNAAAVDFLPLVENSTDRFIHSFATNVLPLFEGARLLALHRGNLPARNPYGGRIIVIGSTRAAMSEAGTENYSASKGAVTSLTHALMMSLAQYGITVNCIAPGWISTTPGEVMTDADREQHPSRRVGVPADVARLCLFLARPGNDFINGENITVDGG